MKFVLLTKESELEESAREGLHPSDELVVCGDWKNALESCDGADMIFVDLIATLNEPHKVEGYEQFALAKMDHTIAKATPLVLIAPPDEYEMDFMTGWPDFVFAHLRRPVSSKIFRRASTWV
jgi:hypothetical protein